MIDRKIILSNLRGTPRGHLVKLIFRDFLWYSFVTLLFARFLKLGFLVYVDIQKDLVYPYWIYFLKNSSKFINLHDLMGKLVFAPIAESLFFLF